MPRTPSALAPRAPRRGFTLIETMVAVTVLALALTGLAPLMVSTARRSAETSRIALRNAIMAAQARRLSVTAYASLTVGSSCTTVSTGSLPNTKCVIVSQVNPMLKRVTLIVTPSVTPTVRPDTVVFERLNTLVAYNPLNYP